MGNLIAGRPDFTPELLSGLRLGCLSSARAARAMDSFGDGINQVISGILGKLEVAGSDAGDFQSTLSAASGADGRSPEDLRKLVDGLLAATLKMEERTKSLEGELQKSGDQVRDLRSKLDNVRKEILTDPLTNIANRKAFDDAVRQAQAKQAENAVQLTLLLCNIDHF